MNTDKIKFMTIIISVYYLISFISSQAQAFEGNKAVSTVNKSVPSHDEEFNELRQRVEILIDKNKLQKADMLLKSSQKFKFTNLKKFEILLEKYEKKEKMINSFITFAINEARLQLRNGNHVAAQYYIDQVSAISKYIKGNTDLSLQIKDIDDEIKISVKNHGGNKKTDTFSANKYLGMKIRQSLAMIFLYIVGILLFLPLKWKTDFIFICIVGFPLGLAIWVLLSIPFLCFNLPYRIIILVPFIIVLSLVFSVFGLRRYGLKTNEILIFLSGIIIFTIFDYIVCTYRYAVFSGDSFGIINRGRAIYFNNGFYNDVLRAGLGKNGVFTYIVQSIAPMIEVNYIYAAMPLLAISLLFSMSYFIFRCSSSLNMSMAVRIFASTLAPLCLATTDLFVSHSFYIHSNLVSGVYLFLFVATSYIAIMENKYVWLVYSFIFLFSFTICRCEAPVFTIISLILLMASNIPYKIKLKFVSVFAIISFLWFGYLALILKDAKFVTPIRVAIMIVPILACAFLAYAAKWKIFDLLLKVLPWVMIYFLIFATGILILIKPVWMADNFIGITENMFASYWGCFWMAAVLMALLSSFWGKIENESLFSIMIVCFLILLFALGFARPRIPYFQRFGDSSNRMLIHIAPLVITYISLKYLKRISKAT